MVSQKWLRTGAILAGLAVLLGAFGARGLKNLLTTEQIAVFQTGVQYQFYHALAIGLVSLAGGFLSGTAIKRVNTLFLLGVLCFSGSLYIITLLKVLASDSLKFVGAITPIGGVFFILGWFWFAAKIGKS
jgi:uncharacterized membrane protein YgdD (TMEM256/DUF423 family)